jgi:hypothetical protein
MKPKAFSRVAPQIADWLYRFYQRLSKQAFDKALMTASRIARRGRPAHEYEFLIHTATFNLLKHDLPWIHSEVSILELLLLESGFIRPRAAAAYEYISYMAPRVYLCLHELHNDHVNPKGLNTQLNDLAKPYMRQEDEGTCFDKDDYQSEVLAEEECDDLYF